MPVALIQVVLTHQYVVQEKYNAHGREVWMHVNALNPGGTASCGTSCWRLPAPSEFSNWGSYINTIGLCDGGGAGYNAPVCDHYSGCGVTGLGCWPAYVLSSDYQSGNVLDYNLYNGASGTYWAGNANAITVRCVRNIPMTTGPSCGYTVVPSGAGTGYLAVSRCNNSNSPVANSASTSECWLGNSPSNWCTTSTSNPYTCGQGETLCTYQGAVDACNALNPGGSTASCGTSCWRLPTTSEMSNWASNISTIGMCDSNNGYGSQWCAAYGSFTGCIGSYGPLCYPYLMWSNSTSPGNVVYTLTTGSWYTQSGNANPSYAASVRCVKNL